MQDCFTGHKKRWCDYLPVFMKDKRKAGGGAGRYVASFFKRVEELSEAQRHRARRLLTGSLGQVENHPKDRCESNHDSPSSERAKKEVQPTICRAWKTRIANIKRRTCLFIAANMRWPFSCASGCSSFTSACRRGRRYVEERAQRQGPMAGGARSRDRRQPDVPAARTRIFSVSPM